MLIYSTTDPDDDDDDYDDIIYHHDHVNMTLSWQLMILKDVWFIIFID